MNTYQDSNTLWHDKPCKDGKPSSNNWMIYTAYAKLLGLPYDHERAKSYYERCVAKIGHSEIVINRHPGKKEPPLSFDEVVGAIILGLLDVSLLARNHYVFHGKGKKLDATIGANFLLAVAKLKVEEALGKKVDRNTFWKENIVEIKQMAYRVNPGQLYFIKKLGNRTINHEDKALKNFNVYFTLEDGSSHSKLLLWALAKAIGDKKLARKCDPEKNFRKDFPPDHPFIKADK